MSKSRRAWHTQYDMLFWNYKYELRRHSYVSIATMELLAVVLTTLAELRVDDGT